MKNMKGALIKKRELEEVEREEIKGEDNLMKSNIITLFKNLKRIKYTHVILHVLTFNELHTMTNIMLNKLAII